jgi:hypothetical protein
MSRTSSTFWTSDRGHHKAHLRCVAQNRLQASLLRVCLRPSSPWTGSQRSVLFRKSR